MLSQGYRIEFSDPPPERYLLTKLPRDIVKSLAMKNFLKDLMNQRVVTLVPEGELYQGFYFHVFMVKSRLEVSDSFST